MSRLNNSIKLACEIKLVVEGTECTHSEPSLVLEDYVEYILDNLDKYNKLVKKEAIKVKDSLKKFRGKKYEVYELHNDLYAVKTISNNIILLDSKGLSLIDKDRGIRITLHKNGNKFVTTDGRIFHRVITEAPKGTDVHHADGITGNCTSENLLTLSKGNHTLLHMIKRRSIKDYEIVCGLYRLMREKVFTSETSFQNTFNKTVVDRYKGRIKFIENYLVQI